MRGFLTDADNELVEITPVADNGDGHVYDARYGATRIRVMQEMIDKGYFVVIPDESLDAGNIFQTVFGPYMLTDTEEGMKVLAMGDVVTANDKSVENKFRIMSLNETIARVPGMPFSRDIPYVGTAVSKRSGIKVHFKFEMKIMHILRRDQAELTLNVTQVTNAPWGECVTTSNLATIQNFLRDFDVII